MTDSFFNFTQAADFATALSQSYAPVNASYDRREQLEQQNDATREKNAAQNLEMFKAIAKLSATAAKAVDQHQDKVYKKMQLGLFKQDNPEDQLAFDKSWQQFESLLPGANKLLATAAANKDTASLDILEQETVFKARDTKIALQKGIHNYQSYLVDNGVQAQLDGAKSADEINKILNKAENAYLDPFLEKLPVGSVKRYLKKHLEEVRAVKLKGANDKLLDNKEAKRAETRQEEILNLYTEPNVEEATNKLVKANEAFFYNGQGGASHEVFEVSLAIREKSPNLISDDQITAQLNRVIPDGSGMTYAEKFPRRAAAIKQTQDEINQAIIDAEDTERKTNSKNFELDFYKTAAEAEKNDEPLTDQYIEGLKTSFVENGFGTREDASFLDDYKTQQERSYDDDKDYIEGLLAARKSYGGNLYDSDFDGMGNKIKAEYASQVKASENTLIPSSDITSDANGEIEGMVNDRHKGAFGTINKGRKYKRERRIAEDKFPGYFADLMGTGKYTASAARDLALEKIQKDLDKNIYNKPQVVSIDVQQQTDLRDARQSIIDDPNIVNTGVPEGLQDYIPDLVKIRDAGRGKVPEIFGLVAANTPYSKWQFANKILENATGTGLLIPAVELDVENLPIYQKDLLQKYSSSSRTSRVIAEEPNTTDLFKDPKTAIYEDDFNAFETIDGSLVNYGDFTIGDIFNTPNINKFGAHLIPIEDMKAVFEMTGLSTDDNFGPNEQQLVVKTIANAKANSNTIFNGIATEWSGLSIVPEEMTEIIPDELRDVLDFSTILPDILNDFSFTTVNYGRT